MKHDAPLNTHIPENIVGRHHRKVVERSAPAIGVPDKTIDQDKNPVLASLDGNNTDKTAKTYHSVSSVILPAGSRA